MESDNKETFFPPNLDIETRMSISSFGLGLGNDPVTKREHSESEDKRMLRELLRKDSEATAVKRNLRSKVHELSMTAQNRKKKISSLQKKVSKMVPEGHDIRNKKTINSLRLKIRELKTTLSSNRRKMRRLEKSLVRIKASRDSMRSKHRGDK